MKKIKVLLVDDQVLFVENLKTVLEIQADDIEVAGIAFDGETGIDLAKKLHPDIVLMDVRMPGMDGVEAAGRIHEMYPDIRIMMLTTFDDDEYVHEALDNGAVGYMLKNMPSLNLIDSIRAVNNGTVLMSPSVAAKFLHKSGEKREEAGTADFHNTGIDRLSVREREILCLISRGMDNRRISEELFIAEQTVKNHISKIYNKLNTHERIRVMQIARKAHIDDTPSSQTV